MANNTISNNLRTLSKKEQIEYLDSLTPLFNQKIADIFQTYLSKEALESWNQNFKIDCSLRSSPTHQLLISTEWKDLAANKKHFSTRNIRPALKSITNDDKAIGNIKFWLRSLEINPAAQIQINELPSPKTASVKRPKEVENSNVSGTKKSRSEEKKYNLPAEEAEKLLIETLAALRRESQLNSTTPAIVATQATDLSSLSTK